MFKHGTKVQVVRDITMCDVFGGSDKVIAIPSGTEGTINHLNGNEALGMEMYTASERVRLPRYANVSDDLPTNVWINPTLLEAVTT